MEVDLEAYMKRVSARLRNWRSDYQDIKARAGEVRAQNELEFARQLDLLEAKLHLAQEKLDAIRGATSRDRHALKVSIDAMCNEIENALDSAWAKLG
ncbi:MAG: hypothetical protein D6743_01560 [Calditrichaeota bacterium]|nr:MAG: hypothetical protein D6743_01560 [Calditrichota bacterium]